MEYVFSNFELNRYYDMGKVEIIKKDFADLKVEPLFTQDSFSYLYIYYW